MYINDEKISDASGSMIGGLTLDLDAQTDVKTVRPEGWCVINGGIAKYVYRVNGGEWQAVVGRATDAPNDIQNDVKTALVNFTKNGDFRNNNNGNKISTADLSADYAGQTVTIEFAVVPENNPGLEENPNAFVFLTLTNVHVAGAAE